MCHRIHMSSQPLQLLGYLTGQWRRVVCLLIGYAVRAEASGYDGVLCKDPVRGKLPASVRTNPPSPLL